MLGYGQILSWSADSRNVVVGASRLGHGGENLTAIDVSTGEARQVVTPPPGMRDSMPAISPDGRMLAFVRLTGVLTGELYLQPFSANLTAAGEPRQLVTSGRHYYGLT